MQNFLQTARIKKNVIAEFVKYIKIAKDSEKTARTEMETFRRTLSFAERYLPWLLFILDFDCSKILKYRELKKTYNIAALSVQTMTDRTNQEIKDFDRMVKSHLTSTDPAYQKLLVPYNASLEMKKAVDVYLTEIEEAESSVSSAKGMETMDMFSSNKTVSFLSYAQNSSASSEIDDVTNGTPAFVAAMKKYGESLQNFQLSKIDIGISDLVDTISDFCFDGFDFMSICTLSQLSDAGDQLETIKSEVEKVRDVVTKNLEASNKLLLDYKKQFELSI